MLKRIEMNNLPPVNAHRTMRVVVGAFIAAIVCTNSVIAASKGDSRAAAIIDNQIITHQQIIDPIVDKLYEAERKIYDLKFAQLRSQLLQRFVAKHPQSKGMSPDQFIQTHIIKNPSATDLEVDQFIVAKRIPSEKINPQLKAQVKDYIIKDKTRRRISNWLDQQSEEHGVIINLKRPDRPRVDIAINGAPTWGKKEAKITLVEYSDFQCPYCARAEATVKQIKERYKDQVKIVYKQFPLNFHKDAFRASEASLCANDQSSDYFWKLHEFMLFNPKKLSAEQINTQAALLGMDGPRFKQCLSGGKFTAKVNQEIAEGNLLGVQATPMFFVNGITVRGAQPFEVFEEIIEEELAR
jgi:protein-disulfide isomerase